MNTAHGWPGSSLEVLSVDELRLLVEKFFFSGKVAQELTQEEFIDAFRSVASDKSRINEEDLLKLFLHIDANASGAIDWCELAEYFSALTRNEGGLASTLSISINKHLKSKRQQKEVYHKGKVTRIVPHPDLNVYYSAAEDGAVKVWDADTLEHTGTLHNGSVCCNDICYLPRSDVLAVSTADNLVTLYNCKTGKVKVSLKGKKRRYGAPRNSEITTRNQFRVPLHTPATTFFGRQPIGLEGTRVMHMLERRDNTLLQRMWAAEKVRDKFSVTVAPEMGDPAYGLGCYQCGEANGRELLLMGLSDGQVQLYNTNFDTDVQVLKAKSRWNIHSDAVTVIKALRDRECVLTASLDSNIHVVHAEKGVVLRTLHGMRGSSGTLEPLSRHQKGVLSLDYSPDLKMIVSCGLERHVLVWNPFVTSPLASLPGHMDRVVSAEFNTRDSQIITLSQDKIIRIWDVRTYRVIQQEKDRCLEANCRVSPGALIFDHKRNRIVMSNTRLYVRQVGQGTSGSGPTHITRKDPITMLCLTVNVGSLLFSSDTHFVKVWDMSKEKAMIAFHVEGGVAGFCLDTETERRLFVANSENSGAQIWNYGSGQLLRTFTPAEYNNSASNEAGIVFAQRQDVRLVILAGSTSVRIYRDSDSSDAVWLTLPLTNIGGATTMSYCEPHSLLIFGNSQGGFAILHLGNIQVSPKGRLATKLPDLVIHKYVSLINGPLHHPVAGFILKAERMIETSNFSTPHFNPPPGKSHHLPAINGSLQKISQRNETLNIVPWAPSFVFTTEGNGLIKLWSAPKLEQVLQWSGVHGENEAIFAASIDTKNMLYYTGDEVGYIQTYDISNVVDIKKVDVVPEMIIKVHCFRCFDACITALTCLPSKNMLLVSYNPTIAMVSPKGFIISILGSGERGFMKIRMKHTSAFERQNHRIRKELLLSLLEQATDCTLNVSSLVSEARNYTDIFGEEICENPILLNAAVLSTLKDLNPLEPELDDARLVEITPDGSYRFLELSDKASRKIRQNTKGAGHENILHSYKPLAVSSDRAVMDRVKTLCKVKTLVTQLAKDHSSVSALSRLRKGATKVRAVAQMRMGLLRMKISKSEKQEIAGSHEKITSGGDSLVGLEALETSFPRAARRVTYIRSLSDSQNDDSLPSVSNSKRVSQQDIPSEELLSELNAQQISREESEARQNLVLHVKSCRLQGTDFYEFVSRNVIELSFSVRLFLLKQAEKTRILQCNEHSGRWEILRIFTSMSNKWERKLRSTLASINNEWEMLSPCDVPCFIITTDGAKNDCKEWKVGKYRCMSTPAATLTKKSHQKIRKDPKLPNMRRSRSLPTTQYELMTVSGRTKLKRPMRFSTLGERLNWRFQRILDVKCKPEEQALLLRKLFDNFGGTASTTALQLINEAKLPLKGRTIGSVPCSRYTYLRDGIIYKLVTNDSAIKAHGGSHVKAMKSAKIELKARSLVANRKVTRTPLSCVVTYKEHRVFVSCIVSATRDPKDTKPIAGGEIIPIQQEINYKGTQESVEINGKTVISVSEPTIESLPTTSRKSSVIKSGVSSPKSSSMLCTVSDNTQLLTTSSTSDDKEFPHHWGLRLVLNAPPKANAILRRLADSLHLCPITVSYYQNGLLKPPVLVQKNNFTHIGPTANSHCEILSKPHFSSRSTGKHLVVPSQGQRKSKRQQYTASGVYEIIASPGIHLYTHSEDGDQTNEEYYVSNATFLLPCQPPNANDTVAVKRIAGNVLLNLKNQTITSLGYSNVCPLSVRGFADRQVAKLWKRLSASTVSDVANELSRCNQTLKELDGTALLSLVRRQGLTCAHLGPLGQELEKRLFSSSHSKTFPVSNRSGVQYSRGVRVGRRCDGDVKRSFLVRRSFSSPEALDVASPEASETGKSIPSEYKMKDNAQQRGAAAATDLLKEEILGRACRDYLITKMASMPKSATTEAERILVTLNDGTSSLASQQFFSGELLPLLRQKYEATPADVRQGFSRSRLIRKVSRLVGIRYNIHKKKIAVAGFYPIVKHMAIRSMQNQIYHQGEETAESRMEDDVASFCNSFTEPCYSPRMPGSPRGGDKMSSLRQHCDSLEEHASAIRGIKTGDPLAYQRAVSISHRHQSKFTLSAFAFHHPKNTIYTEEHIFTLTLFVRVMYLEKPQQCAKILENSKKPRLQQRYTSLIEASEELFGPLDYRVISLYEILGICKERIEYYNEAIDCFRKCLLRLQSPFIDKSHSDTHGIFSVLDRLVQVYLLSEKFTFALEAAQEQYNCCFSSKIHHLIPHSLCNIARAKMCLSQSDSEPKMFGSPSYPSSDTSVISDFKNALDIACRHFGEESVIHAEVLTVIGSYHGAMQNHDTAVKTYAKALLIYESLYGSNNPESVKLLCSIASVWNDNNSYERAMPALTAGLEISLKCSGPQSELTIHCQELLAQLHTSIGRVDSAIDIYQYLLDIREASLGKYHQSTIETLFELAALFRMRGSFEESLALYQLCEKLYNPTMACGNPRVANSLKGIAMCKAELGNSSEAIKIFKQALDIYEADIQAPGVATEMSQLLFSYASLLQRCGQFGEAISILEKSIAFDRELSTDRPQAAELQLLADCRQQRRQLLVTRTEKETNQERQRMLQSWLQGVQNRLCKPVQRLVGKKGKVFLLSDRIGDGLTTL